MSTIFKKFYMVFLLPKIASMTNIIAAATKSRFIRPPPILNIKPISQNRTTIPPSHLKNVIQNHLLISAIK